MQLPGESNINVNVKLPLKTLSFGFLLVNLKVK